jgi:hypothetical protein
VHAFAAAPGVRAIEELLKLAPDLYGITVFGTGCVQAVLEPGGCGGRVVLRQTLQPGPCAQAAVQREPASPGTQADEHALVWTLGQGLGEAFTPEVEEAWVAAYGVLAKTMKDAAAVTA